MTLKITASAIAVASGLLLSSTTIAADEAALPLRSVTLYRAGVGYFERMGKVEGDQQVSLRFETDQINDILKSLVLLDLGGGSVSAVSYGSKEPLARRLASFGIDISDNPSIPEILSRVRGASVRLTTPDGAIEGTILGVEERTVVVSSNSADTQPTVVQLPHLNLVTKQGIKSIQVSRINDFEFTDAKLAEELSLALAALAEQRDEDTSMVDLYFTGAGERPVVLGYITETPVWKTSYRLVLPDETGGDPTLQGWAIVENTTDEDWTGVRLSLASGNPVGFRMDLHEPVFVTRPQIPVPTIAFARPRVYEGDLLKAASEMASAPPGSLGNVPRTRVFSSEGGAADELASRRELTFNSMTMTDYAPQSIASAGMVGEQFRYEISAPVTIERQRSAMLPILTAPVEGRRLSIYNPADNARHPMRGVSFTNSSGFELAPGPIAVYDGSAYAGDAQIAFTSAEQERLLSYAVDLDVAADAENSENQNIVSVRITDGLFVQEWKSRNATTYTFNNRDTKRERTILVEHPKMPGWDLVQPTKAASETDAFHRFETTVPAGQSAKFEVVFERTHLTRTAVTSVELPTILAYVKSGKASQKVADAVAEAAQKQARVNDLERRLRDLETERNQIATDQNRIRENMKTVERNSDLYTRWVQKLTEQETRLEAIANDANRLRIDIEAARKDLSDYISNLTVE